jgi:hypothetical protein
LSNRLAGSETPVIVFRHLDAARVSTNCGQATPPIRATLGIAQGSRNRADGRGMGPRYARPPHDVAAFRLALGWVGCAAVFAVVVGGIAAGAQEWARADGSRLDPGSAFPQTHSVLHVLTMLALAALTAGAAAPLAASSWIWPLAALVLTSLVHVGQPSLLN